MTEPAGPASAVRSRTARNQTTGSRSATPSDPLPFPVESSQALPTTSAAHATTAATPPQAGNSQLLLSLDDHSDDDLVDYGDEELVDPDLSGTGDDDVSMSSTPHVSADNTPAPAASTPAPAASTTFGRHVTFSESPSRHRGTSTTPSDSSTAGYSSAPAPLIRQLQDDVAELRRALARRDSLATEPALRRSVERHLSPGLSTSGDRITEPAGTLPTAPPPSNDLANSSFATGDQLSIKLAAPPTFGGTPSEIDDVDTYLMRIDMNTTMMSSRIRNDWQKLLYLASYLTGPAMLWWTANFHAKPRPLFLATWEDFCVEFQLVFGRSNRVAHAMSKLQQLRQTSTVSQLKMEYQQYTPIVQLNDATLIDYFRKAVHPDVALAVASQAIQPRTFVEWANIAGLIDDTLRETRLSIRPGTAYRPLASRMSNANQKSNYRPLASRFSSAQPSDRPRQRDHSTLQRRFSTTAPAGSGEEHKILLPGGTLSDLERQRRKDRGLCLLCASSQHLRASCPHNQFAPRVNAVNVQPRGDFRKSYPRRPGNASSFSPSSRPDGPDVRINFIRASPSDETLAPEHSRLLVATVCSVEAPEKPLRALVDTGCNVNLIDPSVLRLLELEPRLRERALQPRLIDGSNPTTGDITKEVELTLMVGEGFEPYTAIFLVMPTTVADIVLGTPFFSAHQPILDFAKQELRPSTVTISYADAQDQPARLRQVEPRHGSFPSNVEDLPDEYWNDADDDDVEELEVPPPPYQEFADIFAPLAPGSLPEHRSFDHSIPLIEGRSPPFGVIYNLSWPEQQALSDYLDENLRLGYIQPSSSPAASPTLFVNKKDASLRLCVDYRALNAITIRDSYPIPRSDDQRDRVGRATHFTHLDLRGAYNLIRIAEGEEWKTAFRTSRGLFEYKVMPFGLCNAPATFQRFMNHVFHDMIDRFVVVYLDDILVYSDSVESHVEHVRAVLERCRMHHLRLKLSKCEFHRSSVEFLGYIISPQGISMDPSKTKVVRDWPFPETVRDVRSFLGFINFYRKFIKGFSNTAAPLHELTKKGVTFEFGKSQQISFESLKRLIAGGPVLRHFDFQDKILVETDASDYAIGAVLSQIDHEGSIRPVAFASRKLVAAELNYPVHDKEFLAIFYAFKEWRHYLEGSVHPVQILTDHRSLEYFLTTKQLTRRQARWSEYMSTFNCRIQYLSGKSNLKPDALSRRPDYRPSDNEATSLSRELNPFNYRPLLNEDTVIISHAIVSATSNLDLEEFKRDLREAYPHDADYLRLKRQEPTSVHLSFSSTGTLLYDRKVWVPSTHRARAMASCHDERHAGHPGRFKTLARVQSLFWWPKLTKDVHDYVESCRACQESKISRQKPLGLLQPLPTPEKPWEEVSCDFLGPLPRSEDYNMILVFVDRFTKMAVFVPTYDTVTAADFAELFFEFVYCRYGLPKSILSDRGKEFTSAFWGTMCDILGMKRRLSTAYHPQTDGQTEIVNQWLAQYLRLYVDYTQSNWCSLLPHAELCYNSTVHSTIGVSPIRALTGNDPILSAWDLVVREEPDVAPAALNRAIELKSLHEHLKSSIDHAKSRWSAHVNKGRREATFAVGDLVMLSMKNIRVLQPSRKLSQRFTGPYEVIQRCGSNAFKLKLPAEMRMHPVFNVDRLKPYTSRGGATDPPNIRTRPPVIAEFRPIPATVLQEKRGSRGQTLYFVQWLNKPATENTWVDSHSLGDSPRGRALISRWRSRDAHVAKPTTSSRGWKGWALVAEPEVPSYRPAAPVRTNPLSGRPVRSTTRPRRFDL